MSTDFLHFANLAMGTVTVLLMISLANLVHSENFPRNLHQLFKSEMKARHKVCTSWVEILDNEIVSSMNLLETEDTDSFILKDLVTKNQSLDKHIFNYGPIRLHMPCLLVSQTMMAQTAAQGENSSLTSWPVVWKTLPGHQQHAYHLIWLSAAYQRISDITSKLATLPNPFIALEQNDKVTIFTRNLDPNSWYQTGKYEKGMTTLTLNIHQLNFQGSPVVATVCVICVDLIEDSKKNGVWGDYVAATIFMFTSDLNGTLEPEGVFGLPRDGTNEDGEWDEFVQPTINGVAVLSTILMPSIQNQHVIYSTKPVSHISVVFATARPQRIHYSVFEKLVQPLSSTLWWAILISFVAVVASVEVLIHLRIEMTLEYEECISDHVTNGLGKRRKQPAHREKHEHVNSIHAILDPIIDQNGLRSHAFCKNIRHDSARIVVGLWFLLVIVLNSGYKSMVTSLMVQPSYSRPPTTFSELLASDYRIGCLACEGSTDVNLGKLNSSMSRQLLHRMDSYSYFEPDCFQMILESEGACIGFRPIFDVLGITFTVDVHYKNMAVYSNENLFPDFSSVGVSLRYPAVLDPLNRYIGAFTDTGVTEKWLKNGRWIQLKKGQRNAKHLAKDKSYYLGEDDSLKESSEEALQMFVQLVGFGLSVSACGFLLEYVYFKFRKCVADRH